MFKFITHRSLWINVLTGVVLAFLLLFFFIFSLKWCTHHNQSKTIPQVLGHSYEEAEKILNDAGFNIEIIDSIYTDTSKPNTVLKQVPEADEVVKINRTVYLTINRAVPPMVEMPNIIGYSFRSAEISLKNANLKVGDTTFRSDIAKNNVLEARFGGASISPGTKIRMGSTISLVLGNGLGDQKFMVMNLVGMKFCEARSVLEAQGVGVGAIVLREGENISDSCNAYIYDQRPRKYNENRMYNYIRSGQLIDLFLQQDKPETDTLSGAGEPGVPQ
jgi:beta-lactam-binding protein with PASTA domain